MAPVNTENEENSNQGLTKEQVAIKELRAKITDVISEDEKFNDDFYLLQWLKAQSLVPELADSMIRRSLKWRKENNIHSDVEKEFPPEFINRFPMILSSTSTGAPMGYVNIGSMDMRGGIEEVGVERWIQFWGMVYVQMENHMIEMNRARNVKTTDITSDSTSGFTLLVETKGFPASQLMNLNVITSMVSIVSNVVKYYPQIYSNMIFYNMNSTAAVIVNVVKPVFQLTGTEVAIEAFDSDTSTWQDRLLQITDLEHIGKLESSWKSKAIQA